MDLANIFENIAAQGAMFWVATGSVALGGTLILVALVAQLNRLRSRNSDQVSHEILSPPVEPSEPSTEDLTQVQIPEIQNISPATEKASQTDDSRELTLLVARLRAAGDILENFRRQNSPEPAQTTESPLKEADSAVDYVFRAGLG